MIGAVSGTAVWTFNELAAVTSTGELGNWLPNACPLVGAWSGGGWFDEAIREMFHWSGVRQMSQEI